MPTINYSLRVKKRGKPSSIYVRLRDGRAVDLVAPIGKSIFPKYWSDSKQACKQRINDPLFTEQDKIKLDDSLTEFKAYLLKEYNNRKGEANTDWLKGIINKFNGITPGEITVCSYIQSFIDDAQKGTRLTTRADKMPYSSQSIGNFISLKSQIEHFQDDKRHSRPLKFSDIGMDFYAAFTEFFKDKQYKPNSIGKHIKVLKIMMRFALDEGVHENTVMNQKKFAAPRGETSSIYLTTDELQKIYELKLTGELEQVRDIFYLGCMIAQRISDWRITPDNIRQLKTGRAIELYHQKTGHRVLIPISDQLEVILKKYNDTMPSKKELPDQIINTQLKIIGQKAKIEETVILREQNGNLTSDKPYFKWQLITSHTARRSGITNMYLAKIPILQIMSISGHHSQKQLIDYIKVKQDETAELLASNPYFRNNLKIS